MDPTERFADVVATEPLRLDLAVALIGAVGDPDCDVDATVAILDDLAATVSETTLEAVLRAVFVDAGFVGDRTSYYDPRNSFLHDVLARRSGIPISLSVVLLEVARRVGVPLAGVGTPSHFLVRTIGDGPTTFVDAFAGGTRHDRAGLDGLFGDLAPGIDLDRYLGPLPAADIVRRILNNLVVIYRRCGDRDGLLWSSSLRTMLPGCRAEHVRAFGAALAASGDFARAAKVLESLADGASNDPDNERAEAQRLRARLN